MIPAVTLAEARSELATLDEGIGLSMKIIAIGLIDTSVHPGILTTTLRVRESFMQVREELLEDWPQLAEVESGGRARVETLRKGDAVIDPDGGEWVLRADPAPKIHDGRPGVRILFEGVEGFFFELGSTERVRLSCERG